MIEHANIPMHIGHISPDIYIYIYIVQSVQLININWLKLSTIIRPDQRLEEVANRKPKVKLEGVWYKKTINN